ncbi:MAG: hypothetical protein IBX55_00460 [Methyloprofundus sp.]|nr:hypothetical protein [Methyloprofundus sp.]
MKGMRLTKPCKNCPFRKDIRPYLFKDRAKEISDSLVKEGKGFPCHKTVDYADIDNREDREQCAGAMIMLRKMGRENTLMQVMERLGAFDPNNLDMRASIFESDNEFIQAQDD